MENSSRQSRTSVQKAKRQTKAPAAKISLRGRKAMDISRKKMDANIPDISDVTLEEFMAASEAIEAQKIQRTQRKTYIGKNTSKGNGGRHAPNSLHDSEMLGDQGYSSVAKAAVDRAHRMITFEPRDISGNRSLSGSTSYTGLRAIEPTLQANSISSMTVQSKVHYARPTTMPIEMGVPEFTWPHIVAIGPDHLGALSSLSDTANNKMDRLIQLSSETRDQENTSASILPIITANSHKVPLPPFVVMARHGQKYAIGQATLPPITTLGFAMKPLAPSKEATHTNSIPSRPLPVEDTIQVEHALTFNNDVIARYPEHGCLTHVSFGPTHDLPTIIINRDMNGPARSRAQIQPDPAGMAKSSRPLRT